MLNKKIILTCLLTTGLSMPLMAQATMNLTLKNQTKQDSTVIINHGACSTSLPNHGTTKAGEENVVPGSLVKGACGAHQKDCKGDVYMTNHCNANGEKPVATATMNVATGETNIAMTNEGNDAHYNLFSPTPFTIVMTGGPDAILPLHAPTAK